jgi:hypothetical protein
MFHSYESDSKSSWGIEVPSGKTHTTSTDRISAGSLQRIARALERIADSMDPDGRSETDKIKEKYTFISAWCEQPGRRFKRMVADALHRYFAPASPDRLEKALFRDLRQRIFVTLDKYPADFGTRPPSDREVEEVRARYASFDPARFDWSVVRLGTVRKARLEGLLKRRKELPIPDVTPCTTS